jgi:predicted DCC family thiol-disulfide oxidoreductase YuxK
VPSENEKSNNKSTILFFDGVCSLCNGLVDWVIQNETKHSLHFASLQGTTAQALLSPMDRESLETLIVWHEGQKLLRSDAVIFVLQKMGGFFGGLALIFKIIPRFVRDGVYDFVARHRYQWFGKRDSCRLPTAEEKDRLLP